MWSCMDTEEADTGRSTASTARTDARASSRDQTKPDNGEGKVCTKYQVRGEYSYRYRRQVRSPEGLWLTARHLVLLYLGIMTLHLDEVEQYRSKCRLNRLAASPSRHPQLQSLLIMPSILMSLMMSLVFCWSSSSYQVPRVITIGQSWMLHDTGTLKHCGKFR